MSQAVWSRFAYKSVVDMARVKPGEVFTVLTDDRMIPDIAEAMFAVGLSITPKTQLVMIKSHHFSEEPVHLSPAMAELLAKSDVVLSCCETRVGQIPEVHKAVAGGTRVLLAEPGPRPAFLIDGLINLDYEKMLENVRLFCKLWHEGQTCKITSVAGTNLEFNVGDRPMLVSEGTLDGPGELEWYPGAMGNVAPIESTTNGTIAVDGSLFPFGAAVDLVNLEIEKGVIKDVKGGKFAMSWKAWLDSLNDPVAYHLCHVSVGFNPRAEITGAITEDERRLGAITVGFGRQDPKFGGNVTAMGGSHHLDVILQPPVIISGDKTLLKDVVFNPELGFAAL